MLDRQRIQASQNMDFYKRMGNIELIKLCPLKRLTWKGHLAFLTCLVLNNGLVQCNMQINLVVMQMRRGRFNRICHWVKIVIHFLCLLSTLSHRRRFIVTIIVHRVFTIRLIVHAGVHVCSLNTFSSLIQCSLDLEFLD